MEGTNNRETLMYYLGTKVGIESLVTELEKCANELGGALSIDFIKMLASVTVTSVEGKIKDMQYGEDVLKSIQK